MSGGAGEITVTTLDPPTTEGAAQVPVAEGATENAAPAAAAALPVEPSAVDPASTGQDGAVQEVTGQDGTGQEATPDPAPPDVAEKPPLQIACEKRGGRWATAGTAGSKACVSPTRDGGQQCSRETDCEGLCLARSGSCAPVKPMFGCNEILQADGRRVTLCID